MSEKKPMQTGETPETGPDLKAHGTVTTLEPGDESGSRKVELAISRLLRWGVVASVAVTLLGMVMMFLQHPEYASDRTVLRTLTTQASQVIPPTAAGVWAGLQRFEGASIIVLGLAILVATPILRVAVSIFAFVVEKDWVYVWITAAVLGLLILSMVLGAVE